MNFDRAVSGGSDGSLGAAIWRRHIATPLNAGVQTWAERGMGVSVFERHSDFVAAALRRMAGHGSAGAGAHTWPIVIGRRVQVDSPMPEMDMQMEQARPRAHVIQPARMTPRETKSRSGGQAADRQAGHTDGDGDSEGAPGAVASPDRATMLEGHEPRGIEHVVSSRGAVPGRPDAAQIVAERAADGAGGAHPIDRQFGDAGSDRILERSASLRSFEPPGENDSSTGARNPNASTSTTGTPPSTLARGAIAKALPAQADGPLRVLTRAPLGASQPIVGTWALGATSVEHAPVSTREGHASRAQPGMDAIARTRVGSGVDTLSGEHDSRRADKRQDVQHRSSVGTLALRAESPAPAPRPLAVALGQWLGTPRSASNPAIVSSVLEASTVSRAILRPAHQATDETIIDASGGDARAASRVADAQPVEDVRAERAMPLQSVRSRAAMLGHGRALESRATGEHTTGAGAIHRAGDGGREATSGSAVSDAADERPGGGHPTVAAGIDTRPADAPLSRVTDLNARSMVQLLRSMRAPSRESFVAAPPHGESPIAPMIGHRPTQQESTGISTHPAQTAPTVMRETRSPFIGDFPQAAAAGQTGPSEIQAQTQLQAKNALALSTPPDPTRAMPLPLSGVIKDSVVPASVSAAVKEGFVAASPPEAWERPHAHDVVARSFSAADEPTTLALRQAGRVEGEAGSMPALVAARNGAGVGAQALRPPSTPAAAVSIDRSEARVPSMLRVFAYPSRYAARIPVSGGIGSPASIPSATRIGAVAHAVSAPVEPRVDDHGTAFPVDRMAQQYGVVPADINRMSASQAAAPQPDAERTSPPASPSPSPASATLEDANELAERAWRLIQDKLACEQERRGYAPWP